MSFSPFFPDYFFPFPPIFLPSSPFFLPSPSFSPFVPVFLPVSPFSSFSPPISSPFLHFSPQLLFSPIFVPFFPFSPFSYPPFLPPSLSPIFSLLLFPISYSPSSLSYFFPIFGAPHPPFLLCNIPTFAAPASPTGQNLGIFHLFPPRHRVLSNQTIHQAQQTRFPQTPHLSLTPPSCEEPNSAGFIPKTRRSWNSAAPEHPTPRQRFSGGSSNVP